MEQRAWEVRTTRAFDRWLRTLKDRTAAFAVMARVRRMQVGLFGDVRDVGGGVFELRVNHGPGYRVYGTRSNETLVLLLCAGDKGSQERDIAKAKRMAHGFRGKDA